MNTLFYKEDDGGFRNAYAEVFFRLSTQETPADGGSCARTVVVGGPEGIAFDCYSRRLVSATVSD